MAMFFSVFPQDLSGRVGQRITFNYDALHAGRGGNEGADRYSGTLQEVREATDHDIALVDVADGRGVRSFIINRMSRVTMP